MVIAKFRLYMNTFLLSVQKILSTVYKFRLKWPPLTS